MSCLVRRPNGVERCGADPLRHGPQFEPRTSSAARRPGAGAGTKNTRSAVAANSPHRCRRSRSLQSTTPSTSAAVAAFLLVSLSLLLFLLLLVLIFVSFHEFLLEQVFLLF